jgi:hypothetical protein
MAAVNRQELIDNLKESLRLVTETVTEIQALVASMDPDIISTEDMDKFMAFGDDLSDHFEALTGHCADAVWGFDEENDDIDLMKYE